MAASPFWVILGTQAKLSGGEDAEGTISLPLAPPPRVLLLTVPQSMLPDNTAYASVIAATPSALLLLLHAGDSSSVIDRRDRPQSSYLVLETETECSVVVPIAENEFPHPGHVGFLASLEDDFRFVIAELQPPAVDGEQATLHCNTDLTWERKRLSYPLPISPPLPPHGVVSHSGRLWWLNLFRCLLTCDPFADAPVLAVVDLPPGKTVEYKETRVRRLHEQRCVAASGGKLRFVDMYKNENSGGSKQISVWSLTDNDVWTLDWEVTFQEIWNHESYKATRLPRKTPALMLVHPLQPSVIYFSLNDCLFGVDLVCRKVVEFGKCELAVPPNDHIGIRLVHAWQPPPQPFHIDDRCDSSEDDCWSDKSDDPDLTNWISIEEFTRIKQLKRK